MNIIIESPHFKVSQLLQEYIVSKVNKMAHFTENILECKVLLKLDKADNDNNKVCEIKVHIPGNILFASTPCITFEDAVTETIHALEANEKAEDKVGYKA